MLVTVFINFTKVTASLARAVDVKVKLEGAALLASDFKDQAWKLLALSAICHLGKHNQLRVSSHLFKDH